jgi:hypothetical protein
MPAWPTFKDGSPVHLGLKVYHDSDPRHIGEIVKIWNQFRVSIRWDSGFLSEGEKIKELVPYLDDNS